MAEAILGALMLVVGIIIIGLASVWSMGESANWSSNCTTTASGGSQVKTCSYTGSIVSTEANERLFAGIAGGAFIVGASMLSSGAGSGRRQTAAAPAFAATTGPFAPTAP